MEAEDGKQESNEVSGSINHGRMSITEEEDEVGEDLSEEDDISNEDLDILLLILDQKDVIQKSKFLCKSIWPICFQSSLKLQLKC